MVCGYACVYRIHLTIASVFMCDFEAYKAGSNLLVVGYMSMYACACACVYQIHLAL